MKPDNAAQRVQRAWRRWRMPHRRLAPRDPKLARLCSEFFQLNVWKLAEMNRADAAMWMRVKIQGFRHTVPKLFRLVYRLACSVYGCSAHADTILHLDGLAIFELYLAFTADNSTCMLGICLVSAFHNIVIALRQAHARPEAIEQDLLRIFMDAADAYRLGPRPCLWSLVDEAEHQRQRYLYLREQPPLQRILVESGTLAAPHTLILLDCSQCFNHQMSQALGDLSTLLGTAHAQALVVQDLLPK
jgi:hypothetical protein